MRRPLLFVLLLLAPLGLLACGGDDGGGEAATTDTAAAEGEATDTTDTTTGADPTDTTDATNLPDTTEAEASASDDFPCDLVTTAEVADLVGADLGDGEYSRTQNSQNEFNWTSDKCRWEGDDQEIVLDIGGAESFASGSLECPDAVMDAVEIDGPGDPVYWIWDGIRVQAELQFCTPDAVIEVIADTWNPDDEAGARAALLELAELAVARS